MTWRSIFMALSLQPISLSIAYAIWSGIGTLGTAIIGVFCVCKPLAPGNAVGIVMIVVRVIENNHSVISDPVQES